MLRKLATGCVTAGFLVSVGASAQDATRVRAELQLEVARLDSSLVELRTAKTALLAREKNLKSQSDSLRSENQKLSEEQSRLKAEAQRYIDTLDKHDQQCDGTFTDAVHVRQCNQKKKDLDTWKAAQKRRGKELVDKVKVHNAEYDTWEAQQKNVQAKLLENDKTQRTAEKRMLILREQISRLQLDDKFLIDPKNRDQISRECMSQDTDEGIVGCMKQIFDGHR